jgi:Tannase and feruloyl esterase
MAGVAMKRRMSFLMAAISALVLAAPEKAAGVPHIAALATVAPVRDCASLATADVSGAVMAKTVITSAEVMADGKPAPYCSVTGYVEPMVKFELRLPTTTWTQRFVQTGCGGLCGNLNIRLSNDEGCYPAEHGELALASTDMGHTGGMDGQFGEKDYQLRIDFAYRGVHVTTLAAKALIAAFYGQAAKYSYFAGCSDGGREALMEAERYPQDFNGITAGAPAMNFTTQNTFYHGWNALKNMDGDGKPVLTAAQLPILHKAILEACDAADGLKDGLISDPLSCHFDPMSIECKAEAKDGACLTHAQVEAARAIYAGAHDAQSNKMVLSGPLPGSELAWAGVYIPNTAEDHTMSPEISAGTLKYLAYDKNPAAGYMLKDLEFTPASFTATTQLHSLYDATDPDLSPFAKAGGKLILWHGLADPHISPLNTIAYYTAMKGIMGEKAVQGFSRLYLFPGGYHCGGGEGPFNFDLMSTMMAWVESGAAPFELIASHQVGGPRGPIAGVAPGMPGGGRSSDAALPPPPTVDRTRPVYPYPLTAKYGGTGSIDDAKNFRAGPAKPAAAGRLQWLGSGFYAAHYEVWCTGQGAAMMCGAKP